MLHAFSTKIADFQRPSVSRCNTDGTRNAHSEIITAVYRAQADALEIESLAKRRLADEYDAAQERGEIATAGGERSGREQSPLAPTAADIGVSRKDIHDARTIRDAEQADPGVTRRALDGMLER